MNTLINPYTVVIAFALILVLLDFYKPQISRMILGLFFLAMALIVNLPMALSTPEIFVEAGKHALLPFYQWFFTVIIAWNPPLFVFPLILFEITVGVLILSKQRSTRIGLILGALFCLFLTPIGIEEITSPLLGLAIILLLRQDFHNSLLEIAAGWLKPNRVQKSDSKG